MFAHVKYLNKALGFLFSSRINSDGHYHRDDMLLGHGLDNVASIRVVTGLALVSALLVLVAFMLEATAGMGLLFVIIMQALYLYVVTLPRVGMGPGSAVLNSPMLAQRSYRSYLQGRVLFTPLRLSLSWRARTPETVAADRIRAARLEAACLGVKSGSVSAASGASARAGASSCAGARGGALGGASAGEGLAGDLLKAEQEHNLQAYIANGGHKSGRMIMSTPVTVEDYIIAQGVLAAQRAPGSASAQAGRTIINSGHIKSLSVPLLCDQPVYAGRLMTMEAIAQTLAVRAQELSIEAGACGEEAAQAVRQARERAGGSLSQGAAVSAAIKEVARSWSSQQGAARTWSSQHGSAFSGGGASDPYGSQGAALDGTAMLPAVNAKAQVLPSDLCLYGFGFEWLPRHTRALMHIMEAGNNPSPFGTNGSPDIHAVACDDGYEPIVVPVRDLAGHTLLLGTTGSGKTRFFDLLVSQAIMRGDTVIVLDPKGDRDLQMSLIRAARAAEREPLENMVCLDVGRPAAPSLNSERGRAFASASTGVASVPQAFDNAVITSKTMNIAPMSAFELAATSRVRKGLSSLVSAEHYDAAGLERCGRASSRLIAAWHEEVHGSTMADNRHQDSSADGARSWSCEHSEVLNTEQSIYDGRASQSGRNINTYGKHHDSGASLTGSLNADQSAARQAAGGPGARVVIDGSDLMPDSDFLKGIAQLRSMRTDSSNGYDNTIYDTRLDDRLFDEINRGINPTATFERASEIGSRLKTLIDGPDSVFKDYAIMAVSAAVECCRLLGEKVTLSNIRRYVCQHRNYEMALRQIINLTVIAINNPACSVYYNRIHGISDKRLIVSRFAVSALMGDSFKTVSQSQVEKAVVRLSEIGEIAASDGQAAAQRLAAMEAEDEDGLHQDVEEMPSDDELLNELNGSSACSSDLAGSSAGCGEGTDCADGDDDEDSSLQSRCSRRAHRRSHAASAAAAGGEVGSAAMGAGFDMAAAMGGRLNVSSEGAASALDLDEMERQIESDALAAEERAAAAASKSKTKTVRSSAARPAALVALKEFYDWLTASGYVRSDTSMSQIFQVCLTNSLYFDKTTSSIRPSITGLTSGDLLELLSSEQPQASFRSIVRNNMIFYAGLHCLKDSNTGRNLGKLLLSDLAATAGQIIAGNINDHRRISVFIDEASELANEPLLQLLNKSRSAGFNITIATQSTADLAARMGSRDIAQQFIDNCNNVISLRVMNRETASVVTSGLPATSRTHINTSVSSSQVGSGTSSSISRGMMQEECEKFPPSMLSLLPNFEFVARFANGHFYKGFIPIIDRRGSGSFRPDLHTLQQWQAHAAQAAARSRSNFSDAPASASAASATAADAASASASSCPPDSDNRTAADSSGPAHTDKSTASSASDPASSQDFRAALPADRASGSPVPDAASFFVPGPPDFAPAAVPSIPASAASQRASCSQPWHGAQAHQPYLSDQALEESARHQGSAGLEHKAFEIDDPVGYRDGIAPFAINIEPVIRVSTAQNLTVMPLRDEDFLSMHISSSRMQAHSSADVIGSDGSTRAAAHGSGHGAVPCAPDATGHNCDDGIHELLSCDNPERPGCNDRVLVSPAPLTAAALKSTVPGMDRSCIASSPFSQQARAAAHDHNQAHAGSVNGSSYGSSSSDGRAHQGRQRSSMLTRAALLPVYVFRLVKSGCIRVIYALTALIFSQMLIRMYSLALEAGLILLMVLVPGMIIDDGQLDSLLSSSREMGQSVTAYSAIALEVMLRGSGELSALLYEHTSFTDRCMAVWQVVSSSWQLPLTMAVTGMLWGHHVGLTSELHHRSLMGLRYFTRIRSPLNLVISALAVLMLWQGWLFCIEYTLVVLWLQCFIQAFALSCFFSRHSR